MSVFLASFFLAVAGAPHHHLDGLHDFLLDEPSDSGVLLAGPSSSSGTPGAPVIGCSRLLNDDPCPACFNNDFVSAIAAGPVFRAALAGATFQPAGRTQAPPPVLAKAAPSRAPPAAA